MKLREMKTRVLVVRKQSKIFNINITRHCLRYGSLDIQRRERNGPEGFSQQRSTCARLQATHFQIEFPLFVAKTTHRSLTSHFNISRETVDIIFFFLYSFLSVL